MMSDLNLKGMRRYSAVWRTVRGQAEMKCVVVCIGKGGWEEDWDDEMRNRDYITRYEPMSFVPTLHLFTLPEKCPKKITGSLTATFSGYIPVIIEDA
ncbi:MULTISPECIES: hypothetical protein [Klebsiella]|uniref:hypothetical protein n=1 Tax=Klebsiella TaxID=570 RepID=UPI0012AC107A|nr:hypothetical protein [Klebsiella oxytoca]